MGTPAMSIPPQLTPAPSAAAPSTGKPITPVGIQIPSIGVDDHQFIQVDLDKNHELEVPPLSKPEVVAWYKRSPVPGDVATCSYAAGCVQRTVLDSHVNGDGREGAFARLAKVKAGDTITVDRSDGQAVVYRVAKVLIFDKADFPTAQIYDSATPTSSIALITCGPGGYDRVHRNYRQQTVVLANFVDFTSTR